MNLYKYKKVLIKTKLLKSKNIIIRRYKDVARIRYKSVTKVYNKANKVII